MKATITLLAALALGLASTTHASPYPPESRAVRDAAIGTVLGAGAGAVIGHQSGKRDRGAAIGAVAGGLIGTVVGRTRDANALEAWRREEALRLERARIADAAAERERMQRGMLITDADVAAARERAREAQLRVARLRAERAAAVARADAIAAAEAAEREANAELLDLHR